MDFEKRQDRLGQFCCSKYDSNYLDVTLKFFEKDDNEEFPLVQKFTIGEADIKQFMRLGNQFKNLAWEKNLTPVLIHTMSKDLDEHLKLAHKVVGVVYRANRKKLCDFAAVQCEQTREFSCSSPIICKEEGGREVSTICVCEL